MTALYVRMFIRPSSMASKLARVDWGGILIFVGAATSFTLAISWGGVQYAWASYQVLVPLILGALGFGLFGLYEHYVALEPCVPLKVFGTRNTVCAYIDTVLHALVVMAIVYILPLYYQSVKGYSDTVVGVAVFPQTFTVAPMAILVGILIGRSGKFAWAVWAGWACTVLGLGLLYLLDADTSVPAWIFLNLVSGLGTGALFPAHQFSVQAATDDDALAAAVAMYSFFRVLGQALGVSVGGTIVQNQLRANLLAIPQFAWQAEQLSQNSNAVAAVAQALPEGLEKRLLQEAFAGALRVCCLLARHVRHRGLRVRRQLGDPGLPAGPAEAAAGAGGGGGAGAARVGRSGAQGGCQLERVLVAGAHAERELLGPRGRSRETLTGRSESREAERQASMID